MKKIQQVRLQIHQNVRGKLLLLLLLFGENSYIRQGVLLSDRNQSSLLSQLRQIMMLKRSEEGWAAVEVEEVLGNNPPPPVM